MYPTDRKLVVFQPHLFSRTKDFSEGFASSLAQFDEIILLDIYPAREEPMQGITSEWLLYKIENSAKKIVSKANLPAQVKNSKCRIKLLVGAGDIGIEVDKITKFLRDEA
jgi:UDP-N-acetylmuramate--alanine ligase